MRRIVALLAPALLVAAASAQVPAPAPPPPRPAPTARPSPTPIAPMPAIAPTAMPSFDFETFPDLASVDADLWNDRVWELNDRLADMNLQFNNMQYDFPMAFEHSYNGMSAGPVAWAHNDPADSLYRTARDALSRGDYRRAADLFKSLPQKYPSSAYVADAQYWEAFSLYRIGGTPELREALVVLEARKVDTTASRSRHNGVAVTTAPVAVSTNVTPMPDYAQGAMSYSYSSGFGRSSQTDAAGLAARIATVLSSRGFSSDPAVKAALAAGGNICDEEDQAVRAEALSALMQTNPETGRQMAAKILANRDACSVPLRRNAVMLVGSARDDAAVSTLLPVAKSDPSPSVRSAAISYLVRIQTDAAINAVIDLARSDTSAQVQRIAVSALGQSSDPKARAAVRSIVESSASNDVKMSAIDGLDRDNLTADDAAWLRGLYARTGDEHVKERIVAAVARAGGDANTQWLLALVRNPEESLDSRTAALERTGTTMDAATLGKLYDTSPERPIRRTVIELLSRQTAPAALDKLVDIAKNGTDPDMRRMAIAGLARSKDPRASQLLLQLVDHQ